MQRAWNSTDNAWDRTQVSMLNPLCSKSLSTVSSSQLGFCSHLTFNTAKCFWALVFFHTGSCTEVSHAQSARRPTLVNTIGKWKWMAEAVAFIRPQEAHLNDSWYKGTSVFQFSISFLRIEFGNLTFHQIDPLGRFGLVVTMSVRVSVCVCVFVPFPCDLYLVRVKTAWSHSKSFPG